MDHILVGLRKQMNCEHSVIDVEKLQHARTMLKKLGKRDDLNVTDSAIFNYNVFAKAPSSDYYFDDNEDSKNEIKTIEEEVSEEVEYTSQLEEIEELVPEEGSCYEGPFDLPSNVWHGYFTGYKVINNKPDFSNTSDMQCIELMLTDCEETLEQYLREGIRCFIIDLFIGTKKENQKLIVRLRESELRISKQYGFPVITTIIAKLSPRFQYTGMLYPQTDPVTLNKGDTIILTTERYWSTRGTNKQVYVNCRFLLEDLKPCDFILIGVDIQVRVKEIKDNSIVCIVAEGGELQSRLPCLFPRTCKRFQKSLEELEDITFSKAVGLNVIVSHLVGSKPYFDDLLKSLILLHCEKLRFCARITLDELKCDYDFSWAADAYDGFIVEITAEYKTQMNSGIINFCTSAEKLLNQAYELRKPIIFYPDGIADRRLVVDPKYYPLVFFKPDKYVFKCNDTQPYFHFFSLRNAICDGCTREDLTDLFHCDQTGTGANSLALACVRTSLEIQAKAIFVYSLTGLMAIKISHYRPIAPIILITSLKGIADFISMYQNVTMLRYTCTAEESHKISVYNHLLYGMMYAKSQNIIEKGDNVIFVYCKDPGTKFSDTYITYKVDEFNFSKHIHKIITN